MPFNPGVVPDPRRRLATSRTALTAFGGGTDPCWRQTTVSLALSCVYNSLTFQPQILRSQPFHNNAITPHTDRREGVLAMTT
eukprot:2447467-Pleurochrysis_carterae.AAC.2